MFTNCFVCNKKIKFYPSYIKANRGFYCSTKCRGISKRGIKLPPRTKEHCRNISIANKGRKLNLSPRQKQIYRIKHLGNLNGRWNGGTYKDMDGYIYIYSPNHPNKTNRSYVFEHRLIMEKHIGRYLEPEEVVHHINNIHNDNRIENLKLFNNNQDHLAHHRII